MASRKGAGDSAETVIAAYAREVDIAFQKGNATEHTYRPALKTLIERLRPNLTATNEPQRIECGSPDFIVTHANTPIGYLEAKDIGVSLERAEESDQLKRYRASLRNLILTDHLEFRLFRNGESIRSVQFGSIAKNGALRWDPGAAHDLDTLLQAFFDSEVPTISSPRELAERMARVARLLHDLIQQAFIHEKNKGDLRAQYEGFKKVLIADLSVDQFADMYAQTIAYGLFAARCNHQGAGFTREHAGRELPKTNPFLRKLFNTIAGPDLDERISWAVDDLSELLAKADIASILADFGRATRQLDPVVHFYETFLAAYDPKERERRGVYYTPEPVVSYIVRSVDSILRTEFDLPLGLADNSTVRIKRPLKLKKDKSTQFETIETHKVQILDPAAGTGTFLYFVIRLIRASFDGNEGMWPLYVSDHLLPRIFGFELLMAPYAIAHMKLGLELKASGYDFTTDERLRVFLTNTLEEAHELTGLPLFTQWLSDEATSANGLKKDAPIMVVIGNPPYSGHSANAGTWIRDLLRGTDSTTGIATGNYFEVDGVALADRGSQKWLNDDYVKFIRFAQWRIEQTGYGILAFITNHAYLDNPTFRGMRQSLQASFDKIYLLDLHGSAKKKAISTTGGKDENVFDIQQGVAINLFIKRNTKGKRKPPTVRHADLWGSRESKYKWLEENSVATTAWSIISPNSPSYFFVPRDETLRDEYEDGWSIPRIFNQVGEPAPGFVTTQDQFAISWTESEAISKVDQLLASRTEAEAREFFKLCSQDQWNYDRAKTQLADGTWRENVTQVLYRPFDLRWTVWNKNVAVHRRERVNNHMLNPNIALITSRLTKGEDFRHAQVSHVPTEVICMSPKTSNNGFVFPLYLYQANTGYLFDEGGAIRRPNISPDFIKAVSSRVDMSFISDGCGDMQDTFGPENLLNYIYALLYSSTYRTRYAQFLQTDFPRIPLPSRRDLFVSLERCGQTLVATHSLTHSSTQSSSYPVSGTNRVDKVDRQLDRVYINADQYFSEITDEIWFYQIGGYQPVRKWLNDRKTRVLTFDDLNQYRRIVAAIEGTLRIQEAIDRTIPVWDGAFPYSR